MSLPIVSAEGFLSAKSLGAISICGWWNEERINSHIAQLPVPVPASMTF